MRFRILLIVVMIACSGTAGAQTGWSVTVGGGISFAAGEFRQAPSFARSGMFFSLQGTKTFGKKFFAGIRPSFALHSVAASELATWKLQNDPFLTDLTVRSDPFLFISTEAVSGVNFFIAENQKAIIQISAGWAFARTPYQLYKTTYFMTGPPYYEITSAGAHSFTTGFKAGYQVQISSCFSAGINAGLQYAPFRFYFDTASGRREDKRTFLFVNTGISFIAHF
ncbi:MAG: hypothetical protein Kow00127_17980 [Bacteroidales bacterium]